MSSHFIDHERETRVKFILDTDMIMDDLINVLDEFIDYTYEFLDYLVRRDIHIRVTSVAGNKVNDTDYWEPGIWIDGEQILGVGNNYSVVVYNPANKEVILTGTYNISADDSEAQRLIDETSDLQGNGYIFIFNSYGQPADGDGDLYEFFQDNFGAAYYDNYDLNKKAWCMIHAEGRGNVAEKLSPLKDSTLTIDTIIRTD